MTTYYPHGTMCTFVFILSDSSRRGEDEQKGVSAGKVEERRTGGARRRL